jgi:hypothetical protein
MSRTVQAIVEKDGRYARPGKLFTASESLIERTVGKLSSDAVEEIISALTRLLGAHS